MKILGERDRQVVEEVTDWEALVRTALECKLVVPLSAVLEASPECAVPQRSRDVVATLVTERTLASLYLTRQLHLVLALLHSQGLKAITYKGVALAQLAFGNLNARETSDLDILVPPTEFKKAYEILRADGFECHYPRPTASMFRQSYEISLIHPSRGVNVDLHRAFLPECYPFKLDLSSLTAYSLPLLGREVPTLEPTEHLLVMCAHGSKHGWRELRWIHDLHHLCRAQTIDWERLEVLAREHRTSRAVAVGLELSRRLFGTTLPSFPPEEHLVERTLRQLGDKRHSGWRQHRYQWEVADDGPSRCRYLGWALFYPHQRDLEFLELPASLWPLYYLIRPFRAVYERLSGRLSRRSSQSETDD